MGGATREVLGEVPSAGLRVSGRVTVDEPLQPVAKRLEVVPEALGELSRQGEATIDLIQQATGSEFLNPAMRGHSSPRRLRVGTPGGPSPPLLEFGRKLEVLRDIPGQQPVSLE